jgi:hypothetical protein
VDELKVQIQDLKKDSTRPNEYEIISLKPSMSLLPYEIIS